MARLLIAGAIAVVAVLLAFAIDRRRRRDPPTQPKWSAPVQLDRTDFPRPTAPWLIAVFSSATCDTCARVVRSAVALADADLEVIEVEVGAQPALHRRYRIDAVPITVVADAHGVVRADFIGPVSDRDLAAAVARLRGDGG